MALKTKQQPDNNQTVEMVPQRIIGAPHDMANPLDICSAVCLLGDSWGSSPTLQSHDDDTHKLQECDQVQKRNLSYTSI